MEHVIGFAITWNHVEKIFTFLPNIVNGILDIRQNVAEAETRMEAHLMDRDILLTKKKMELLKVQRELEAMQHDGKGINVAFREAYNAHQDLLSSDRSSRHVVSGSDVGSFYVFARLQAGQSPEKARDLLKATLMDALRNCLSRSGVDVEAAESALAELNDSLRIVHWKDLEEAAQSVTEALKAVNSLLLLKNSSRMLANQLIECQSSLNRIQLEIDLNLRLPQNSADFAKAVKQIAGQLTAYAVQAMPNQLSPELVTSGKLKEVLSELTVLFDSLNGAALKLPNDFRPSSSLTVVGVDTSPNCELNSCIRWRAHQKQDETSLAWELAKVMPEGSEIFQQYQRASDVVTVTQAASRGSPLAPEDVMLADHATKSFFVLNHYAVEASKTVSTKYTDLEELKRRVVPLVMELLEKHPTIKLGNGESADVIEGTYRKEPVAVKCLKEFKKIDSEDDKRKILREILVMQRLQHDNIVRFYGASMDEGYIVLELAKFSLFGLLYNTDKAVWRAGLDKIELLLDILAGLSYLHFNGVIHRDIKSGNILMFIDPSCNRLVAKVADFGLSTTSGMSSVYRTADSQQRKGTAAYMAPELFHYGNETVQYSTRSDMYAFGVLANEVMDGKLPWGGLLDPAIVANILSKRRPIPFTPKEGDAASSAISALIGNVSSGCLSEEPGIRPTAEVFGKELIQLRGR